MVPLSEPYAVMWSSSENGRFSVRGFIASGIVAGMTVAIRLFRVLCENPVVRLVADFGHQRKIVATEAAGIFPIVAVLIES